MLDIPLNVFPVPARRGCTCFPRRNLWYGHTVMERFVVNSPTALFGKSDQLLMQYWVVCHHELLCIPFFMGFRLQLNTFVYNFLSKQDKSLQNWFLCKNRRKNRITPTAELKPEMQTVHKTGPERIEKKTLFSLYSCTKLITRCTYIFYVKSDQTEYLLSV